MSSDRQVREGHGLQGQEQRCRAYAQARGYEVEGHQTALHEKSLGVIDYTVLGVVLLVMIGALTP